MVLATSRLFGTAILRNAAQGDKQRYRGTAIGMRSRSRGTYIVLDLLIEAHICHAPYRTSLGLTARHA